MTRWLVVVLLLSSGCAFALSGPDPERPHNQVPRCDTTKGLVALDGVMATGLGVIALAIASENEPGIALLPAAIGALYLGGAISGNQKVNKCRAAMDDFTNVAHVPRLPDRDVRSDIDEEDEPVRDARLKRRRPPPPDAEVAVESVPDERAGQVAPAPAPVPAPVPASAPAAPATPAAPLPKAKPASAPKPPAPKPPAEDEWSDFWQEVP